MNDNFKKWLPDVINSRIIFDPNDLDFEARENTWSFSIPTELDVSNNEIDLFINTIIKEKSKTINNPMTFYVWYDEMSGNLCISLSSQTKENLPFKCVLHHTDSLEEIINICLRSKYRDGIPLSECKEIKPGSIDEDENNQETYILKIWSKRIGTIRT